MALPLFVICTVSAEDAAQRILRASGVKGGLVVHVGCGDGKLTAAFRASDSYVVHGLDARRENVEQARRHIRSLGLYGNVAVDAFDGGRLPYADNLINLLVVSGSGLQVSSDELARVLAPRGVALVEGGLGNTDTRHLTPDTSPLPGWTKFAKPWPDMIDEWTHFLHGPDNNAVAEDRVVGPPRHMQWLAGPRWTRHHHTDKGTYPTIRAVVSSHGRLYYMVDETPSSNRNVPSTWFLAARDAFSGVLLWKTPVRAESYERRLELVWRTIVADGERVYASLGTDLPLSALDGATGEVLTDYAGTQGFQEMIKDGDTLFVASGLGSILALRADTGARLWQWQPGKEDAIVPLTMAASDGRVFVKTENGVRCLSAEDGKTFWQIDLPGSEKKIRLKWPRERLLVKDGVVLCSYGGKDPKVLDRDKFEYLGSHPRVHDYGGKLAALSAEDGSLLWTTDYLPGLESTPGEIYISNGLVWLGPAFAEPRDLRTGAIKKTRHVLERLWTTGHHYRCYPGKATSKYIITAKRGIEMFDLTGENHSRNNWVRATCRVGVTPANGLLYAPPHSCGCYMEAKLYGFWALAATSGVSGVSGRRLFRGPAYGDVVFEPDTRYPTPESWPTYRHDAARSGNADAAVPVDIEQLWRADVGGRLSAVTVADGRVYVAQVDAHTVYSLDAASGKALWKFTAGGRVDSPPTIYQGLVLFGSRDGWVYCLRGSDGELVWRFLAAPQVVSAVAYEQVESLWPVHGSLLVNNGIVYVAAGRSSYLDGGIVVYGLDPKTGDVRCTTRLKSEHTGALDPPPEDERSRMDAKIAQNNTDYKTFLAADRSDAFSMRGALTDVMVADGDSIFLRHMRFDEKLVRQEKKRPHLFSTSSLLDDAEHHRSYWVLGTGDFSRTPVSYPWIATKSLAVPYGLMLAFDERTVWGVHRSGGKGQKQDYAIFAMPRPGPSDKESLLPDFATRSGKKGVADELWTAGLSMRPRAMILASDTLIIGGEGGSSASSQDKGGFLRMISSSTGDMAGEVPLGSPPVWDGIAAAARRLYVTLADGSVVCLGETATAARSRDLLDAFSPGDSGLQGGHR